MKDAISKCTICNTLKLEQCQEPLRPHEVPDRPWSKVGTDLFTFKNQTYIVAVDYYSNFIEMDRLRESSSKMTIKALKTYFSRHGIPDVVVSDNGLQYSSEEFCCFLQEWKFKHIMSSPKYPQSNGKAESAVETCKTLLKKAELARTDVYLSLLDHRNTPTEQTGLSPAKDCFVEEPVHCYQCQLSYFSQKLNQLSRISCYYLKTNKQVITIRYLNYFQQYNLVMLYVLSYQVR